MKPTFLPEYLERMTELLETLNNEVLEMHRTLQGFDITKQNKEDNADNKKSGRKKKDIPQSDGQTGTPAEGVQHYSLEEREGGIPDAAPAM